MINFLSNLIYPSSMTTSTVNPPGVTPMKPDTLEKPDSLGISVRLSLSPEAQKLLKNNKPNNQVAETIKINDSPKKESPLKDSADTKTKLSPDQVKEVRDLKVRDLHVKMHEGQHMAAAGAYAVGGPHYEFTTGPDGTQYAVGGEVQLDTSPIANNPEATITKAATIRQAALAPADPSGADRSVAAAATQMEAQARKELAEKTQKEQYGGNSPKIESADKGQKSKIEAYKNFLQPSQIGKLINRSA